MSEKEKLIEAIKEELGKATLPSLRFVYSFIISMRKRSHS